MVTEQDFDQFTGSEQFYRHRTGNLVYTEGVKFLADQTGAYWLIDAIASYQRSPKIRNHRMLRDFQIWELSVSAEKAALLTCKADSDLPVVIRQEIEFTDFPLPNIKLWVESSGSAGNVLMLPSER